MVKMNFFLSWVRFLGNKLWERERDLCLVLLELKGSEGSKGLGRRSWTRIHLKPKPKFVPVDSLELERAFRVVPNYGKRHRPVLPPCKGNLDSASQQLVWFFWTDEYLSPEGFLTCFSVSSVRNAPPPYHCCLEVLGYFSGHLNFWSTWLTQSGKCLISA